MKLRTLQDIKNLKNKRVLVRVDYNVALKHGKVLEPERIERSFPTINYLLKKQAKVILMSHLGRPDGKFNREFSLKPVAYYLDSHTKKPIQFVDDCVGEKVEQKINKLKAGGVLLLENLRFYPGEEQNDAKFALALASLADIYVNDAFAMSHRAHASVAAITKFLPSYAGLNLSDEVFNLSNLLKDFKKPAVAIIGGIKIETKIKVIENFLKKYDYVLIGGALANNFLAVQNINIGKSVYDKDYLKVARNLLKTAKGKLILPIDLRITNKIKENSKVAIVSVLELSRLKNKNFQIIDIGPKTEIYYESFINMANTLALNGPMGLFEISNFSHGTKYITQKVAIRSKGPAFGVVGGGETILALDQAGVKSWPDFVSTAGGAMLEFLEGKILPGIKPLISK